MIRIKGTGVSKSLINWDDKIYVEFKVNKWGYGFVWYRSIWTVGIVVLFTN